MITLSNGYKKPETGDFGDVWFPALEDNIDRVNDHNHDGTNSEKLAANAVEAGSQSILQGDFILQGDGRYRATVSLTGFEVDKSHISFRDPTTREPVFLEFEYVTATSIYVYCYITQDFTMVLS